MNRSRASLGAVGVLVLGQACGAPPDPVVKPPPLVITATPPIAPTRAKWAFSDQSRSMNAKVDLGKDTGVLYVGAHGRRSLIKGDADPVDSSSLAFDDLVGVLKDDKGQLVFVADDGDVFVSKDALGALDTTRPSPLADVKNATLRSPATGKTAIMGIASNDNRVLRTSDFGVTWKPVDYAGATKPWGKPVSVALDGLGNGILIHLPQRVFVTHDDGATWAPIASPGIGARRATRDGANKIFVDGFDYQRARLDGNSLAVTTDQPEPADKPADKKKDKPDAPSTDESEQGTVQLIAGDHSVELASVYRHGKTREVRIRTSKLGQKADAPISNTDLISRDGVSQHVASYNNNLVYLRADDDSDQNTPTSTLFFSKDYGATWTKDATIEGAEPQSDSEEVALGPKGWAFVGALCTYGESYGEGDDSEGEGNVGGAENCSARKVRPAGAKDFEDMAFTEDFTPSAFAFDEAHDKVYAVGTATKDNETRIYVSALSQNKWVRSKIDTAGMDVTALSVDPKGVLRAYDYDYTEGWIVARVDADDKPMPKEYLALDSGDLTFVGARGLLISGHNKGWETADGGETWVRVATNGSREADCSEAGCRSGDAFRIGWDLPAAAKDQTFTASTEKPTASKVQTTSTSEGAPTPTLELTCKVSGASTITADQRPGFDTADNRADVRWTMQVSEGSKTSLVVGGKNGTRDVLLVPAEKPAVKGAKPDNVEHRSGTRMLTEGAVGARFSFQTKSSTGTYNPVDIELTWFSYASGKVGHHTIAKHPAFRVASYGFTGDAQIVPGGLLYQATDGEPATFIHDDGKTEPLPLPSRASVRNAMHAGTRWILSDSESGTVQIATSDDTGKTWKNKAWTLDESAPMALSLLGGKPMISINRSGTPAALFGLEGTLPDDPPAPTVVDFDSSVANACDASAGTLRTSQYLNPLQRQLKAKIDDGKKGTSQYSVSYRMTHGLGTGKACTSAYKLSGGDEDDLFVYADGATWTGWRFRRDETDPKKTKPTMEPITCK